MTSRIEEDLYGGSSDSHGSPASPPGSTERKGPTIRYGRPDEIARFWRFNVRPHRNSGCSDSIYGTDIVDLAVVTSDNYRFCQVAPLPGIAVSHILLCGDTGTEYECTPVTLSVATACLRLGLGERTIDKSNDCTPKTLNSREPFHIKQADKFFYISQGLVTDVVNRCDFTKTNYETREKKPLTIAFSGLQFTVTISAPGVN